MNIVRKVLLPVAAGLLISPAVMAADIVGDTEAREVSGEYLGTAAADDVVLGGTLAIILGAEYAVDDVITLAFTAGALDPDTLANSVIVPEVGVFKGMTLGLLSSSANSAVYRVTALEGLPTDTTVGLSVQIAATNTLEFDAQAVDAAGGVTVAFSAATSTGLALDTSGGKNRAVLYLDEIAQFSAEVTEPFSAVVDVNEDRLQFTAGGKGGIFEDWVVIEIEDEPSDLPAVLVDVDYMVSGDFSFLFDQDDVAPGVQADDAIDTCAADADNEITATYIAFTCVGTTGWINVYIDDNTDPDTGDLAVLPATTFTATVSVNFDGFGMGAGSPEGTKAVLTAAAAGKWLLNGFQALLPYMPYGSSITQVIYLVNRGLQSGDVSVDWVDSAGNTGSLGVVATLGATTTLSIGPAIQAALPTAQRTNGRLALTVTANVPSNDAQINAQYNVSGNRAFTLHEDNRND